jgi:hypothetical protein
MARFMGTGNADELTKKLRNSRPIWIKDQLILFLAEENHYTLKNNAFPQICLEIRCKPERFITVGGEKCQSAFRSETVGPIKYTFEADRNYQPYIAGENDQFLTPTKWADSVLDIVAEFFREVATR